MKGATCRPFLIIGLSLAWIAASVFLSLNNEAPVKLSVNAAVPGSYEKMFIITAEETYWLELGVIHEVSSAAELFHLFKTHGEKRDAEVVIPVRWSVSNLSGKMLAWGDVAVQDVAASVGEGYIFGIPLHDKRYLLSIARFKLPRGIYRLSIEFVGSAPAIAPYRSIVEASCNFKNFSTGLSVITMISALLSVYVITPFVLLYSFGFIRKALRRR